MRFSLRHSQLCLFLGVINGGSFCEASRIALRGASPFLNVTRSASSSSSSVEQFDAPPVVTPTATLLSSSTTTNFSSSITPAPLFPWGNQSIPVNTCSVTASDGGIQYTPCNIFAGTVQMSFFPENSGNVTYPTEYYNTELSITMTSPSVYMIVNTISGDNSCGPLGPTYHNKVISMDLTELSTLQPYADHTVTTRMGPPQPLTLSDLTSNCFDTYSTFSTDGEFLNTHPVYGNYNRCRPRFVPPIQLKRVGYPYWTHCGNDDYIFGIFDPPAAVPPVTALLPAPVAPITSTFQQASALPTAAADQAASTSSADPVTTPSPPAAASSSVIELDPPAFPSTPAATAANPDPSTPVDSSSPADPPPTPVDSSSPAALPPSSVDSSSPADLPPTPVDSLTPADPTANASPPASSTPPSAPITTPLIIIPTSATAIAIVGSNTISAVPGSSGVVLPNGSTAQVGSVATVTDANSQQVVVSVGTSGIFISGSGTSSTFIANPTVAPIAIATVASQVVSAAPGATKVVIGSQTAFLGGAAITVSDSVVQLTPSGVVVHDPAGGVASTFAIPTMAAAHDGPPPTPIATVGGQVISAAPGDSTVVINGQVITAGGPVVTLAGSNNVVSLGSSALIIQYPSGVVSSFALPTSPPTPGAIVGTIAGIAISAPSGASVMTIGGQTVSIGGPAATVSNDVVSLGSSGLKVQMPGGGVTTLSAAASSRAAGVVTSLPVNSSKEIASMIASIAGASTQTTSTMSATSSSYLPTQETTAAGHRMLVEVGWSWTCLGVSLVLVMAL